MHGQLKEISKSCLAMACMLLGGVITLVGIIALGMYGKSWHGVVVLLLIIVNLFGFAALAARCQPKIFTD